jgi:hypothetical protein
VGKDPPDERRLSLRLAKEEGDATYARSGPQIVLLDMRSPTAAATPRAGSEPLRCLWANCRLSAAPLAVQRIGPFTRGADELKSGNGIRDRRGHVRTRSWRRRLNGIRCRRSQEGCHRGRSSLGHTVALGRRTVVAAGGGASDRKGAWKARGPRSTAPEYFDGLSTRVCTKQCGRPLSGHLHEICTRFTPICTGPSRRRIYAEREERGSTPEAKCEWCCQRSPPSRLRSVRCPAW